MIVNQKSCEMFHLSVLVVPSSPFFFLFIYCIKFFKFWIKFSVKNHLKLSNSQECNPYRQQITTITNTYIYYWNSSMIIHYICHLILISTQRWWFCQYPLIGVTCWQFHTTPILFFLNTDTHKRLSKCTNNSGCYSSCNIKLIFLFFSYKQLLPDKKITVGNI